MPNDTPALSRIQQAARIGRILFSSHAREEMANAGATERDVEFAIESATSALLSKDGEGRFKLTGGTDQRGEELVVVVREIQPGLIIVTVW